MCPMEKPEVISSVSNVAKPFALFSKHGDGRQHPPPPPSPPPNPLNSSKKKKQNPHDNTNNIVDPPC